MKVIFVRKEHKEGFEAVTLRGVACEFDSVRANPRGIVRNRYPANRIG